MKEPDAVAEAQRILAESRTRDIRLRLIGGVAFRLRSPEGSTLASFKRTYVDIDLIGLREQSKSIKSLFKDLDYVPRERFNQINGKTRLVFNDLDNGRRVDIFLNVFNMCHNFDFTDRLAIEDITLPLADLLLTKLQVFEITEREYRDVLALLHDNEVGTADGPKSINAKYIGKLCGENWGLYRTVTLNLDRIKGSISQYSLPEQQMDSLKSKIGMLEREIETAPKSLRWKARASVGEKVRWYELPEADREVVDSRSLPERQSPKQGGSAELRSD